MSLEEDLKIAEQICVELAQVVDNFNAKVENANVSSNDVIAQLEKKVRHLSDVIQGQKMEDIEKFGPYAEQAKGLISSVLTRLESYKASLKTTIEEQSNNTKAHNAYMKATQTIEE